MEKPIFVVGLDASFKQATTGNDRQNGGTLSKMLDETLDAAKTEGKFLGFEVVTKHYYLHEVLKEPYTGKYTREPDWIKPMFDDLRKCDILIAASQTCWFGPSSLWQSCIEYLTALEHKKFELTGKVAGLLSTCHEAGGDSVLKAIFLPFTLMGLQFPPFCALYRVDEGQGGEDNWQNEPAIIGQNTVRSVLKQRGHQIDDNGWFLRE